MSPHRSQEHTEICTVCRDATEKGCPRCAIPLCADHMPAPKSRCEACEGEFLAMTKVERHVIDCHNRDKTYTGVRRPFLFAPFGTVALLLAVISLPVAAAITIAGLVTMRIVPPTVPTAKIRLAFKRKRFLVKKKRRAKRLAARRAKRLKSGNE